MNKIYLTHNGCLNLSLDYNILKKGLQQKGLELVDQPADANDIVFAGCGVRAFWVDDLIQKANEIVIPEKQRLIITGCTSAIETNRIKDGIAARNLSFRTIAELLNDYTGWSFEEFEKTISQRDQEDMEGESKLRRKVTRQKLELLNYLSKLDQKYETKLAAFYRNNTQGFLFYNETEPCEFIVIARSCLYKCTFCTIPKGRGDFHSVSPDDILAKVNRAVNNSIYRFYLIGDEVGNYGKDGKHCDLSQLLDRIFAIHPGIKLGIRYIEPSPFMRHYDTLHKYCSEDRIFLLHVPLQTGSQQVLKAMQRNYPLEKIIPKYKALRDQTRTIFYSNWLVGFPGETAEDFGLTKELVQELNLQQNTTIPFSSRPGTPAFESENKLADEIIDERMTELNALLFLMKKKNILDQCIPAMHVEEKMEIVRMLEISEKRSVIDKSS